MKKLSVLLILVLLLSGLAGCAFARPDQTEPAAPDLPTEAADVHPMLFHVTSPDGAEGWLFGTIHVGDRRIDTALEKLKPYLLDRG